MAKEWKEGAKGNVFSIEDLWQTFSQQGGDGKNSFMKIYELFATFTRDNTNHQCYVGR